MGKYSRGLALIFLISAICVMSIGALKTLELTDVSFDSYSSLMDAEGIFDAGWIPIWLPQSARHIRESHDLDTNEGWLAFQFVATDIFYSVCILESGSRVELPEESTITRFRSIFSESRPDLSNAQRWSIYVCGNDSNRYLFVDKKNGQAYVWLMPP